MNTVKIVSNDAGIMSKFTRIGYYDGAKYVFTHRDPKSGNVWSDDIPVRILNTLTFGKWVPNDQVHWLY